MASSSRTSRGVLLGSSSLATSSELLLILVQIGVADFEKAGQAGCRPFRHRAASSRMCRRRCGSRRWSGAARSVLSQQEIVVECGNDGGVGLRKFGLERAHRCASAKARGTSCSKKRMIPGSCSIAICVKMRGGFCRFVRASREQARHLLLARDQRTQAIVGGSKLALHQREGGVGAGLEYVIGVFCPWADGVQGEAARADLVEDHLPVAARGLIEGGGGNRGDALLKFVSARRSRHRCCLRAKSSSFASYW